MICSHKIRPLPRPSQKWTRDSIVKVVCARAPDKDKHRNKHFAALAAGSYAPKVQLTEGPAGFGLVATAPIQAQEAVLVVPHHTSLVAPEGSSVYSWECNWLEPFESWHGHLPAALAYFLSDREAPALPRLATLILYIRKHDKGELWQGWLNLLPSLDAATYPGGPWTEAELQQLQLGQLKLLVSDNHSYYVDQAHQLFTFLTQDPDNIGLKELQLAHTVEECQWALFIAATRGSDAGSDDSSLHPLHDLMNHSDTPNCKAGVSTEQEGFIVQAAMNIKPGTELTICYAQPDRLSSVEMLLSWGFYPPTRPTDWVFCQHIHALPLLHWESVVAAAGRVVKRRTNNSSSGGKALFPELGRLQAVIGSLPLLLPRDHNTAAAAGAAVSYSHAVEILLKYGSSESEDELSVVAKHEHASLIAAQRFKAPNPSQRLVLQEASLQNLLDQLSDNSSSSSSSGSSGSSSSSYTASHAEHDEVQRKCAIALSNECTIKLAACDTTMQQDELLLGRLLHQKLKTSTSNEGETGSKSRGFKTGALASKQMKAKGFGTVPLPAANDKFVSVGMMTPEARSQSSSSSSSTSENTAQVVESLYTAEQQATLLLQLQHLQQQVLSSLLWLQATNVLQQRDSSSIKDQQAAKALLAALAHQQQQRSVDESPQWHLQSIASWQDEQAAVLELLHQQQKLQHAKDTQIQLKEPLGQADVRKSRLIAAVAARLEQKRMLQLCVDICREVAG